jgi:hypothetical protein
MDLKVVENSSLTQFFFCKFFQNIYNFFGSFENEVEDSFCISWLCRQRWFGLDFDGTYYFKNLFIFTIRQFSKKKLLICI